MVEFSCGVSFSHILKSASETLLSFLFFFLVQLCFFSPFPSYGPQQRPCFPFPTSSEHPSSLPRTFAILRRSGLSYFQFREHSHPIVILIHVRTHNRLHISIGSNLVGKRMLPRRAHFKHVRSQRSVSCMRLPAFSAAAGFHILFLEL